MKSPGALILNPPLGRLLVVGDIHGCRSEFEELLDRFSPQPIDRIILLGDLINRGPDSAGVVRIARKLGAASIVGNHEWRILRARAYAAPSMLKAFDRPTVASLNAADWTYLSQMALTIYLPRWNLLCVHGGFLPGRPWPTQGPEIVTHIQVVDDAGRAARRSDSPGSPPWAHFWKGPPFVLYGHTPRPQVLQSPLAWGLDTGCVYGGQLTAVIYPSREIIQIPARRAYLTPTPNFQKTAPLRRSAPDGPKT